MLVWLSNFAAACRTTAEGSFLADRVFGIPTWYKYLPGKEEMGKCVPAVDLSGNLQGTAVAILLGIFDIVLFVAGLVAVAFIIFGAFQYMLSQGEPDKSKNARSTIINALIGLTITIFSTVIVRLIGSSLT